MTRSVNRQLDDEAFDHIDHALGRPVDPMEPTFRDHFAADGALAIAMAASPYWCARRRQGDLQYFQVTLEGRSALAGHLRQIKDPHRSFIVTFNGHAEIVIAKSPAKARYSRWLDAQDHYHDLRFVDFCRRSHVRRAA